MTRSKAARRLARVAQVMVGPFIALSALQLMFLFPHALNDIVKWLQTDAGTALIENVFYRLTRLVLVILWFGFVLFAFAEYRTAGKEQTDQRHVPLDQFLIEVVAKEENGTD